MAYCVLQYRGLVGCGKMKIESYSSKRGDKVVANEKALGDYRDRQAIVVQHGPGTAEFVVAGPG